MADDEADDLRVTLEPRSAVGIAFGIVVLFALAAVLRAARPALALIVIGVLLSFALDPLVKIVQRRLRSRRLVAVVLVSLVISGAFVGLVTAMGPAAISQTQQVSKELPNTVRDLYKLPVVGGRLEAMDAADKVQDWANDLPERFDDKHLASAVRDVVDGAANGIAVFFVAFAVLLDGEVLIRRGRSLVPVRHRPRADRVARVLSQVIGTYFAGTLFVAVIAFFYVLALGLILGVPLAPLAAVWYAVVRLIPQIGGFLGVAVFTILALSHGLLTGILGLALIGLFMNAENYIITPAIVGKSVDLSPPTTMIATILGATIMGIPGALVGIPLTGTCKALYMEYRFGQKVDYGTKPGGILRRISLPSPLDKLIHRFDDHHVGKKHGGGGKATADGADSDPPNGGDASVDTGSDASTGGLAATVEAAVDDGAAGGDGN